MDIKGCIILITGGASGLGAATAAYLADRGAEVVVADKQLALGQNSICVDLTQESEVETLFREIKTRYGQLHVVIQCAGIMTSQKLIGREGLHSILDFKKIMDVNVLATFQVMRLSALMMSEQSPTAEGERGVIINTASIAAYEGQMGQVAYSASKGAICSMTVPASRELAQFGVRVMTIAPGVMETPMVNNLPDKVKSSLVEPISFPKRFGWAKEFAQLTASIIENSYLNGGVIRLDGGLRMPAR